MEKTKLKPQDVADKLGISVQAVRIGLQQGVFPFGWAVKTSSIYTYCISEKLFKEFLGERV